MDGIFVASKEPAPFSTTKSSGPTPKLVNTSTTKLRGRKLKENRGSTPFSSDGSDVNAPSSKKAAPKASVYLDAASSAGDVAVTCSECPVTLSGVVALRNHVIANHGTHRALCGVACGSCGKFFTRFDGLVEHVALKHGNLRLICQLCDERFRDRHNGARHMKAVHGVVEAPMRMFDKRVVDDGVEEGKREIRRKIPGNIFRKGQIELRETRQPSIRRNRKRLKQKSEPDEYSSVLSGDVAKKPLEVDDCNNNYRKGGTPGKAEYVLMSSDTNTSLRKMDTNVGSLDYFPPPVEDDTEKEEQMRVILQLMKRRFKPKRERRIRCNLCGSGYTQLSSVHYHLKNAHGVTGEWSKYYANYFNSENPTAVFPKVSKSRVKKVESREDLKSENLDTAVKSAPETVEKLDTLKKLHTLDSGGAKSGTKQTRKKQKNLESVIGNLQKRLRVDSDSLTCSFCSKPFKTKSHLKNHVLFKHENKVMTCHLCSSYFRSRSSMWMHLKRKHGKDGDMLNYYSVVDGDDKTPPPKEPTTAPHIYCKKCGNAFRSRHALNAHAQAIHGTRVLKCKLCGIEYTYHSSVINHLKNTHGVKENTKDYYVAGQRENKEEQGSSSKGESARISLAGVNHAEVERSFNVPDELACRFCEKSFESVKQRERHEESYHLNEFNCEVCGEKFESVYWLERHKLCHVESEEKCLICCLVFNSKFELSRHYEAEHNGKNCNYCGKSFETKTQLTYHVRKCGKSREVPVIQEKPRGKIAKKEESPMDMKYWKCNVCAKMYPKRFSMLNHLRREHAVNGAFTIYYKAVKLDREQLQYVDDEMAKFIVEECERKRKVNTTEDGGDVDFSTFLQELMKNSGDLSEEDVRGIQKEVEDNGYGAMNKDDVSKNDVRSNSDNSNQNDYEMDTSLSIDTGTSTPANWAPIPMSPPISPTESSYVGQIKREGKQEVGVAASGSTGMKKRKIAAVTKYATSKNSATADNAANLGIADATAATGLIPTVRQQKPPRKRQQREQSPLMPSIPRSNNFDALNSLKEAGVHELKTELAMVLDELTKGDVAGDESVSNSLEVSAKGDFKRKLSRNNSNDNNNGDAGHAALSTVVDAFGGGDGDVDLLLF